MSAPERTRNMYRARYWRDGWKHRKDSAHTRFFTREEDARRFLAKIETAELTPAGPMRVELSKCEATPWEVMS